MTDRTRAVHFTAPRNWLEMGLDDAMAMKIQDGDWVKVASPRGEVFVEVRIVDTLQPGVVWMPFHYSGGANHLTDAHHLDPISKIPGYKQVGVKIEKVSAEKAAELAAQVQKNEVDYYLNEEPETIRYKEQSVEDLLAKDNE
jgi:formate dehydrogenase major subunit